MIRRQRPTPTRTRRLKLPGPDATYAELDRFFDRHDAAELLDQGITAVDPDRSDLEAMLAKYWKEPNTKQLNVRIPATAKRIIDRLAKQKTLDTSTLVRMWIIESMRREAQRAAAGGALRRRNSLRRPTTD